MPYKDKDKQKKALSEHYQDNKKLYAERCNARKRELHLWFQELKTTLRCSNCEETHVACLDFHHEDRSTKEHNVCFMASKGYKKERILEEIAKCTVLCSNCHRKLHYDEKHNE